MCLLSLSQSDVGFWSSTSSSEGVAESVAPGMVVAPAGPPAVRGAGGTGSVVDKGIRPIRGTLACSAPVAPIAGSASWAAALGTGFTSVAVAPGGGAGDL